VARADRACELASRRRVRSSAALAAISAAAWFDFFFTQPYERFTISHSSDVTTFVLLLAVGIAVSQLAAHARHLKAVTVADAGYLARIVDSAALTQSAGSPDAVVQHVRKHEPRLKPRAARMAGRRDTGRPGRARARKRRVHRFPVGAGISERCQLLRLPPGLPPGLSP
jgi:K+-sensing histidine kinase KdpD